MTLSFFFSNFYFFTLKDFFVFNFLCTANIVCILHMFLGFFFFRPQNLCAFCDCREKGNAGGGEYEYKKQRRNHHQDARRITFVLLLTMEESHARFIM